MKQKCGYFEIFFLEEIDVCCFGTTGEQIKRKWYIFSELSLKMTTFIIIKFFQ